MPPGEEFLMVVAAYNNSLKPGFAPPELGGQEVDLYTVRVGTRVRAVLARL
jgi:hypothetical protein